MTADRATLPSLLLCCLLAGCTQLSTARRDRTLLDGEVPVGLGRSLRVHFEGGNDETRAGLLEALERELVGRDLFDRVLASEREEPEAVLVSTSGIWLTLLDTSSVELFDLWEFQGAFVARYELEVELRDEEDRLVLQGHVSGIGVDDVTDSDYLDAEKQDDVRVAAQHDAAMKMSRALRRAANERAAKASGDLPTVELPPGIGPVSISVLGFDDDPGTRRRRGPLLTDALARALTRLGHELAITSPSVVRRAVERELLVQTRRGDDNDDLLTSSSFFEIRDYQLELIAQHLPATQLFVVGRVDSVGGAVTAEVRLLTRSGARVLSEKVDVDGLGALRVVAAELAGRIGDGLKKLGEQIPARER